MDHYSPAGPGGGNLRHEYAIVPEGAVGQTGLFSARGPSYGTERGPSYDTERRWQHQSPSYTLRTVDSTCRLAVLEDGKVSAQWELSMRLIHARTGTLLRIKRINFCSLSSSVLVTPDISTPFFYAKGKARDKLLRRGSALDNSAPTPEYITRAG
jgi:hypothetical protein